MKLYTPFFAPESDRPPVLVVERPSLRVLVFGWLGLVFHGAWMPGLLAGAATVALHLLPASGVVVGALAAGLHLGLSAFTPDIRRWDLRLRGYRAQKVVAGPDRDTALLRLLDRHPPTLNGDATVMGAA